MSFNMLVVGIVGVGFIIGALYLMLNKHEKKANEYEKEDGR